MEEEAGPGKTFLLLFYASSALTGIVISGLFYSIPVYIQMLGYSPTEIGVGGSLVALPYVAITALAGPLYSAIKTPRVYVGASIAAALSALILLLSRELGGVYAAQVMLGAGLALYYPIAEIIIAKLFPPERRSRVYSYYGLAWSAGFLIGPGLSGILLEDYGPAFNFVVLLYITLVSMPLPLLLRARMRRGEGAEASRRRVWGMPMLALLCYAMFVATIVSVLPGVAKGLGYGAAFLGISYSVYSAARTVGFTLVGRLGVFSSPRGATLAALMAVPFILMIHDLGAPSLFPFVLGAIGVSVSLFMSSSYLHLTSSIRGDLAVIVSSFEFFIGSGYLIGPFVAGLTASTLGVSAMMLLSASFAAAASILVNTRHSQPSIPALTA